MPRNHPMLVSVVLASLIGTVAYLVNHYTIQNAFDPVNDFNEAVRANLTQPAVTAFNETLDAEPWDLLNGSNATSPLHGGNGTIPDASKSTPDKSFWWDDFPKQIFFIVVVAIVRYWWMIYLERLLPARPRQTGSYQRAEKEDDDSREEEVIRKWIEAGKVQRSSLSWFNTFAKWMIDLTVGNFGEAMLVMLLLPLSELKSPWKEFNKLELLFQTLGNLIGIKPFASLLGFILASAPNRIVLEAGVDLVWDTFFGAFLQLVVPWAMSKEMVQEFLRNGTIAEFEVDHAFAPRLNETGADEL